MIMVLSDLVEAKRLRMFEHEILRTGETEQKTMSVLCVLVDTTKFHRCGRRVAKVRFGRI
jgi:hypothetical protein